MNLRFVCSLYYNQPIVILLPFNSVPTRSDFKYETENVFFLYFFFINVVLRFQDGLDFIGQFV